jgi:hypothetical protein
VCFPITVTVHTRRAVEESELFAWLLRLPAVRALPRDSGILWERGESAYRNIHHLRMVFFAMRRDDRSLPDRRL